jgi:hypothetical protein
MMAVDLDLHLENQARLRELYQDPRAGVTVFCTHDVLEFEALQRLERRAPSGNVVGRQAERSESAVHAR